MSLVWDTLAEALGERYVLERELGRGGMATVYLAHDLREDRPVAIKVMRRGLAGALGTERFLREVEIAASLVHPGIVPLYESGEAGGLLYYIMPYIAGESLFDRLERERQLPLDDALRITAEVSDALGYAHSRGVLHRDMKPENILLAGYPPTGAEPPGRVRAMIADFGLARAIGAADYKKLTETGIMVGTVYYMSPEQLLGQRDLDQRADVYSVGCILYEMLTGEAPYASRALNDVVTQALRAPIPSVQKLRAGIPSAIDQALAKALAKSATDRFATMEAFTAALPTAGEADSIAPAPR